VAGRLFRRKAAVDGPPAVPPAPSPSVDQHAVDVRLFTTDGAGDVQVLAGTHRVTDVLNAPDPVRLRAPREADAMVGNSWVEIDDAERDEILAVLPPPRRTDPQKRLHRLPQEISMRVGPYVITGQAHVPAGAEATGFLLRHRPHFVPLTQATIRQSGQPDVRVPISIVNLRVADGLSTAALLPAPDAPALGQPFGARSLPHEQATGTD
jgi:hypothetical protein